MYFRLIADRWDKIQLIISENQKDYDITENDSLTVFIYGYPFNPKTGSWVKSDYICSKYSKNNFDFIQDIEGIYTILILDKVKKTTTIITDRYGIYNLFYHKDEYQLIISDKIAEIVTHINNGKLNELSIMEYLFFGFKLGSKTHIEGINEFEGATIIKIDSELKIKKDVYWNLIERKNIHKMTNEEFRRTFNKHIKTAFSLEKNISIPLSGGLDTRTILSSSINQNLIFECYTYGTKNAPDVIIAKKICEYLKIKHRIFEIDEKWIQNIPLTFKKGAINHNGLIPPYSSINQESFEEYSRDKLVLIGVLGNEVWRGLLADKNLINHNRDTIVDTIMNLFLQNKIRVLKIFNGYSEKEIINKIRKSLESEMFGSCNYERPIEQFEEFVLKNWGSNWASNGFKSAGKHFKIFSAFLNKDLLPQIVLQNRYERVNGSIQKYIISMNNPYLASVKLDTTDIRHGTSINNNLGSKLKDVQAIIPHYSRAAVNYIPKRLFKRHIFKTPFFTDYPKWLRDYHEDFIWEVLDHDKMFTKEIIKEEKLEDIIRSFFGGDDSLEQIITRLMGLELWLSEISRNFNLKIQPAVHMNHGIDLECQEKINAGKVGDE